MTTAKRYPYGCKMLTVAEIVMLHPHSPSRNWVAERLHKGMKVYEILAEPLLTVRQRAKLSAKASPWGRENYIKMNGEQK